MFAENYARTDEQVWCLGTLGLAHRRKWALNEKRLDERAGLRHLEVLISGVNQSVVDLAATVTLLSAAVGVNPLRSPWLLILARVRHPRLNPCVGDSYDPAGPVFV